MNKEFEKAIDYLTPLHNKEPDEENIHILILDAMFALGKNENDFKWKVKPVVHELNDVLYNSCKSALPTVTACMYIKNGLSNLHLLIWHNRTLYIM